MAQKEDTVALNFQPPIRSVTKFPRKLWKLVNSCTTGAISWNHEGDIVVIRKDIFETQFLKSAKKEFKTEKLNSLVRQLNLYGFQRVPRHTFRLDKSIEDNRANVLEYRHMYFRRENPELLTFVRRRMHCKRLGETTESHASLFARVICPKAMAQQNTVACTSYVPLQYQKETVLQENPLPDSSELSTQMSVSTPALGAQQSDTDQRLTPTLSFQNNGEIVYMFQYT